MANLGVNAMMVNRWTRLLALTGLWAATVAVPNSTAFLSWVNPQAYTDGSALDGDELKQVTIRCSGVVVNGRRQSCAIPPRVVPGGAQSTALDFTFSQAAGGQVCFQAQAETVNGAVSDWSAEACKTIAGKKPMPPVLTLR